MMYKILNIDNLPNEIWNNLPFTNDYLVSNFGRVKSCKFNKEKILRQFLRKSGYLHVGISVNGKTNNMLVHRLVSMAFLGESSKNEVNHKNGVRYDNKVENLEWVTSSENALHAFKHLGRKRLCGELNFLSKKVKCENFDIIFDSVRIASKEIGISKSSILNVCNNRYNHVNGLVFKYA